MIGRYSHQTLQTLSFLKSRNFADEHAPRGLPSMKRTLSPFSTLKQYVFALKTFPAMTNVSSFAAASMAYDGLLSGPDVPLGVMRVTSADSLSSVLIILVSQITTFETGSQIAVSTVSTSSTSHIDPSSSFMSFPSPSIDCIECPLSQATPVDGRAAVEGGTGDGDSAAWGSDSLENEAATFSKIRWYCGQSRVGLNAIISTTCVPRRYVQKNPVSVSAYGGLLSNVDPHDSHGGFPKSLSADRST
jgi:hypothetical protein